MGVLDKDFLDLKLLVGGLVLDARKRLLSKNENIQFPEVNFEVLTCQIMEKILNNLYK